MQVPTLGQVRLKNNPRSTFPLIIMLSLTKIQEGLEVCYGLKWQPFPFLI